MNTLDDGFGRPKTMNYLRLLCMWNIQISPLTKITKLMPSSYRFPFISACWERNEISEEVILISLWTRTDFGGIYKIIQVYERYDGVNKMQIEQHWVIPQTVPYSVQTNWKVLRRNNRIWKMAKWDFVCILTLERKWKTHGWMP